jgi:hypothetical protein
MSQTAENCTRLSERAQRDQLEEIFNVSATPVSQEPKNAPADGACTAEPFHNPSYPVRTHFQERQKLQATLRDVEDRLSAARKKLDAIANDSQRARSVRLYHQLMGARDQIAECVRRIPLEAAALYVEDQERYHNAVAAFERIWGKWQGS